VYLGLDRIMNAIEATDSNLNIFEVVSDMRQRSDALNRRSIEM
jgi:hypothetical protein